MDQYSEQVVLLREKAELFKKSNYAVDGIVKSFEDAANTIEKLTEELQSYKEKQKQGKIIELPCEVGQPVYWVENGYVYTFESPEGLDIRISDDNIPRVRVGFTYFAPEAFGKVVFTSLSEAEEAAEKERERAKEIGPELEL